MSPFWNAVGVLLGCALAVLISGYMIQTVFPSLNFWQGAAAGFLWLAHISAIRGKK